MKDLEAKSPQGAGSETSMPRLFAIVKIRWALVALAIVAGVIVAMLERWSGLGLGLPWPLFVVGLPLTLALYNTASLWLVGRFAAAAVAVGILGDLVATTVAIHGTGGTASWVWSLYPLVTLEAAFLTEATGWTLAVGVGGVLFYALGVALEGTAALAPAPGTQVALLAHRTVHFVLLQTAWVALVNLAAGSGGLLALGTLARSQAGLTAAYRQLDGQYRTLGQLDRLKTSFMSAVSHELRTPVTIVQGYAELLEEAPGLTEEERGHARAIGKEATKLGEKIAQVLDYTALAAHERVAKIERVAVAALLEQAAAEARPGCEEAGITISVAPPSAMLSLQADAELLGAALRELMLNARQATSAGGRIGLVALETARHLVLEVWDTGPGVPVPIRAAFGQPFADGGIGLTEHTPGLGLGLARANLIAALHGGTLEVGDAPGGGASMRLVLPRFASGG
jgi:signal transduction histidine kinase